MTLEQIITRVHTLVAGVAGPSRIPTGAGPETPLGQDGYWLDSVDLLEVVIACQEAFDVEFETERDLTPETLHSARTLGEMICARLAG